MKKINWQPVHDRVKQSTLSCIYKFHTNDAPEYMNEIFCKAEYNGIPTRFSYKKLKLPYRKTNQGLRALSYIGPSLWNNLDNAMKESISVNAFKHNIKKYYFQRGKTE